MSNKPLAPLPPPPGDWLIHTGPFSLLVNQRRAGVLLLLGLLLLLALLFAVPFGTSIAVVVAACGPCVRYIVRRKGSAVPGRPTKSPAARGPSRRPRRCS